MIRRCLKLIGDKRQVYSNPEARYFGAKVDELTLVPAGEAWLGHIGLADWSSASMRRKGIVKFRQQLAE